MKGLNTFREDSFIQALKDFFEDLQVPVNYIADEPASVASILGDKYKPDNPAHKLIDDVYVLGIVDDAIFEGQNQPSKEEWTTARLQKIDKDYDGLVIFGVALKQREGDLLPTRSQLAEITRAFNRAFHYTPVTVVFKYGGYIAFANSERAKYKQEWREGERAGKVSLLKDIDFVEPHRGHLSILDQLRIETTGRNAVRSFAQLYYYWQAKFSISVLNKIFYQEIITWFNKAIQDIRIPGKEPGSEQHKDFAVRLIARLIFIWFLKELKVVKEELLLPEFDNGDENDLIKPKITGTSYYKFILQNLFFNALNSEQEERNQTVFDIYASSFADIEKLKELIFYSPYLNGGLFDINPNDWCEEGKVNNAFVIPDRLFLDKEKGLNSVLSRYKFTIAENTPLEEEVAVDPEMLGRIFENLLAEQSDDTREAARSAAGAFYTPRPVVSYICRNTLLKHLGTAVVPEKGKQIIQKLLNTTVLDPACGSGAFPMGMLEEMMQVLETVDPEGNLWIAEMLKSNDSEFLKHIADFIADKQTRYVKKLGLLRNCLFGIDMLEYAIEITKLRCWLSLIVEQKVDFSKRNYNLKPLPNLDFKFYKKNSLFRFYRDKNLNQLIDSVDNKNLLGELVDLENEYFIAKSSHHGNKEEIKAKIIGLLERVVDSKSEAVFKELNIIRAEINRLTSGGGSKAEINKQKKKETNLGKELGGLAGFRNSIKDYFIERVVFPGIFNKKSDNPGFDIVIGNPPYVNTKLISSMGLSRKLEEEYGYCDDLYNHFTVRGLELIKKGGLLSYITSDTFLTLQTKKNLRIEFLGIPKVSTIGGGLFANETKSMPECRVMEIINTPKAFAALVDTAIFTLKKEQAHTEKELVYIDLRKPNAASFEISEEEWKQIKTSKENLAGWERVLDHTFSTLGHCPAHWVVSHNCDGDQVYKDEHSSLLKFKVSFEPYRKAINYAIFSPTPYNCQILEKIVKPARPVFDNWWDKIETSRKIEQNRIEILKHTSAVNSGDWSIVGLITDGGVGLQTGDNGRFVGYKASSRFAQRCRETRSVKLYETIQKHQEIPEEWDVLNGVKTKGEVENVLFGLTEQEIWQLFDGIKGKYGLRVFGKGCMYRIIPSELEFNVTQISEEQKLNGIDSNQCWVPYDKGDKEGNRWYLETPYLIEWNKKTVTFFRDNSGKSGAGMPVVRNPQFYFRNGFCWNESLNPNSVYIKCRQKQQTVNDVSSMSLYEQTGLGDDFMTVLINSYCLFKLVREFLNNTVKIQMNDIRKLPIKIPTKEQAEEFKVRFNACLEIKKRYFAGGIERTEASALLKPLEVEIDEMVNRLYGISLSEEIAVEEMEEELVNVSDEEDLEDED